MTRRHLGLFFAATLALGLLPGCNGLSIDFWDERDIDVNVPAGADTTAPPVTTTVDLSQDTEIKDKLSQVSTLEVPEVWLEVSNVDPTNQATSASGKLEVSEDKDGATPILLGNFTNLAIGEGGKTKVELDTDAQKQAEQLLQKSDKLRVTYSGSLDKVPAIFHLKARIHIQATVNANLD